MELIYRSLAEEKPGTAWRRVFANGWPGWNEWFLKRGGDRSPDLDAARRALRRHMPPMEPIWETLVAEAGADGDAARFLTFWTPPRYLVNCSQAVLTNSDGPMLIRNYDLDPALNEAMLYSTAWRGKRVTGMAEGMAGLADGMNEDGLAISLTFGGRPVTARGFGVPLILRYVLEVGRDAQDALAVLRSVPCHMSYNITVIDRSGAWATVYLAPDRPPIVTEKRHAVNHQLGVEWPRHGRISRTLERDAHLETLMRSDGLTAAGLATEFRRAPLFSSGYAQGFGTVYTAVYRPAAGEMSLAWRTGAPVTWRIDAVEEREIKVAYSRDGSAIRDIRQARVRTGTERTLARPDGQISAGTKAARRFFVEIGGQSVLDRARHAAFWRRNTKRSDGDWSNLNDIAPGVGANGETS